MGPELAFSPHSLLFSATLVTWRGGLSSSASPERPRVPAHPRWMARLSAPTGLGRPPPRPRLQPRLRAAGCPRHLAVPQFRKHLLRAHCEPDPRQPSPHLSPATLPFPAGLACRLRDSRRRSPGPAGAAGEEPPHGWLRHRPPRRLQGQRRVTAAEARPEPARRVRAASPLSYYLFCGIRDLPKTLFENRTC